jgi:leucyl aminopeptidase (aminopeptidase T)
MDTSNDLRAGATLIKIYDLLNGAIIDTKLQIDGISGSGQVTIDDELVSYEDEIVIYV